MVLKDILASLLNHDAKTALRLINKLHRRIANAWENNCSSLPARPFGCKKIAMRLGDYSKLDLAQRLRLSSGHRKIPLAVKSLLNQTCKPTHAKGSLTSFPNLEFSRIFVAVSGWNGFMMGSTPPLAIPIFEECVSLDISANFGKHDSINTWHRFRKNLPTTNDERMSSIRNELQGIV